MAISGYHTVLLLEASRCLVVGGGNVGTRRAIGLLEAGAEVCVVSPTLSAELLRLEQSGSIEAVHEAYRTELLENARLVFAATDNRQVNAQIGRDARARGIEVNVADAPAEGSLIMPATLRRGALSIAVYAGGNPLLGRRIRDEIAERYGSEYGELVDLLERSRSELKRSEHSVSARRAVLEELMAHCDELLEVLRWDGPQAARVRADDIERSAH